MHYLDFYNAVSSGDLEKLQQYHFENGKLLLNKNIREPFRCRLLRLPLIEAFYEGRLGTARYLYQQGALPDIFCRRCRLTPRYFMPEGFLEGNCRIMSLKVFRDRVWEAERRNHTGVFDKKKFIARLLKKEPHIQEIYEYATNESMFNATFGSKCNFEEILIRFRHGDYIWPCIHAIIFGYSNVPHERFWKRILTSR